MSEVTATPLLGEITVSGAKLSKPVTALVTNASISDTIEGVTVLSITVIDNGLALLASGMFATNSKVQWKDQSLVVKHLTVSPGENGHGQLEVECRPSVVAGLEKLRGPKVFAKTDAAGAIRLLAGGLKVVAQSFRTRTNISVNGPSEGQLAESYWEAFARWAEESGAVLFEANGTIFFGKPSWLIAQIPTGEPIVWDGPARTNRHVLELPTCTMSDDLVADPVTVTVSMHAELASKYSAGMLVAFSGVPGFAGDYWVTSVSGPLSTTEPWTVSLAVPTDPKPTEPTGAAKTATKKTAKPSFPSSSDEKATVIETLRSKIGA